MEIEANITLSAAVQQKHLIGLIQKYLSTLELSLTLFKQRLRVGTERGRVFNLTWKPRFYAEV